MYILQILCKLFSNIINDTIDALSMIFPVLALFLDSLEKCSIHVDKLNCKLDEKDPSKYLSL